jgi:AcrR family transcriptional regulator
VDDLTEQIRERYLVEQILARFEAAALALTAKTFDYNIAVTAALAQAYLEVVQGDLAELDSARRALIDALLSSDVERRSELGGRAIGLGFDADRQLVAVAAGVGSAFSGLDRFSKSYREAHRALRHTPATGPFVFGPEEVPLFDELTISTPDDARVLIPEPTCELLADAFVRETVEALLPPISRSRSRPRRSDVNGAR